jgi:hypothetical protein
MKWQQVRLDNEVVLSERPSIRVARVEMRDSDGRRHEILRISSSAGWSTDLDNAIDTSGGRGEETVCLALPESGERFFVFGGPLAYRIGTGGKVEARTELHRDPAHEEWWVSEFHECSGGGLVVYEGGLFLLDAQLNMVWHQRKYYNDQVEQVSAERVDLVGDRGERWFVTIQDGRRTDK